MSAVAGGAVCARLARVEPRARALPPPRARLEHRVLLPVPGAGAATYTVLLDHCAALRAAARHGAASAQRGARAHGAPLEPREPASARPQARSSAQAEPVYERRRRYLVSAVLPVFQPEPEPRAEASAGAPPRRGEGGAQRHVRLAVHVASPLAQRALARHRAQCAPSQLYPLLTFAVLLLYTDPGSLSSFTEAVHSSSRTHILKTSELQQIVSCDGVVRIDSNPALENAVVNLANVGFASALVLHSTNWLLYTLHYNPILL